MHLENVISIGAIITCAGALLKLAFQHGAVLSDLRNLVAEVKALVSRVDKLAESEGRMEAAVAVNNARLIEIERRLGALEGRAG